MKKTQKKAIDELVKAKNQRLIIITMRLEKKKDSAKSKVDEEAKKLKDNIDKGATNNDVSS